MIKLFSEDKRMIKHVIFDCFGTLIDTGSGSRKAVKTILNNVKADVDVNEFYKCWKNIKKKMMRDSVFRTEKKLFELSLAEAFAEYGIEADAAVEVKPMIDSLFGERFVFDDVKPALESLKEAGVDYAIGSTTDTDSLEYFLKFNELKFDIIFTSEDMKVYKPDRRFYETIIERTGWNIDECIFVGDNIIDDVYGPKSIGMKAILLDRKGTYDESDCKVKPDYVIKTLREIEDIFQTYWFVI